MRDIPFFTTQCGIASLTLSQIPYTGDSYIRIQSASDGAALLRECADFCRAAGGENVYATGHPVAAEYPLHTEIWKMRIQRNQIPLTAADLRLLDEQSVDLWRDIYNEKMRTIPNASVMTRTDAEKMQQSNSAYFVYSGDELLGIGAIAENEIRVVAAVVPGSGVALVAALNTVLSGDYAFVEVASENHAAIKLYQRMGFTRDAVISQWYKII